MYVWQGGFQCFSGADQGLGFQAQPGVLYCCFLSHQHIKQRGINFDSARLLPLFGECRFRMELMYLVVETLL